MKTRLLCCIFILAAVFMNGCKDKPQTDVGDGSMIYGLTLDGQWGVRLDPEGLGLAEKWFQSTFIEMVDLPGSLAENGLGNNITVDTKWTGGIVDQSWFTDDKYAKYREPGNVKVPFWLQPVKHYVGNAWYQKTFDVPAEWAGKQIVLHLERCHWEATVCVDDKLIGTGNSLSTPNEFVLGKLAAGEHRLTICIDNTVKIAVGESAHSVSDHTQSNWNGIVGEISINVRPDVYVDDMQIYPDIDNKVAKVVLKVVNDNEQTVSANVSLNAKTISDKPHDPAAVEKTVNLAAGENVIEVEYAMGEDCLLWDEFSPNVYTMTANVTVGEDVAIKTVEFGMREFKADGTQFTINGRKTFLRGTLECAIFPLTGYAAMDEAYWTKMITAAQDHGFNHFRFHSWCPPEAAFDVADRLGFYFQVECGGWATVGDGKPVDKFFYDEGDRILKHYGNHPSFVLMAYGNEPGGGNQKRYLGDLVNYWKAKDSRRLYTSASGWPKIPENEFHVDYSPRIQHWGAGLNSRINSKPPETTTDYTDHVHNNPVPLLSHEIGQWCVYPNFEEMKKYTGVLKAKNFEIFRDSLEANHMLDQAHDFLMASGKLQTLCYKEDIESLLRTPGMGGYQLLDLHDFPGQGTALVGVLDPFWEEKGYVSPAEYHSFSCETVPLARMAKRWWTTDETFVADIEVAHFGSEPIKNAVAVWSITGQDGKKVAGGKLDAKTVAVDNGILLGKVSLPLEKITKAEKMMLAVTIEGTQYSNDWDLWVYPSKVETAWPEGVSVVRSMDDDAVSKLSTGSTVLLLPQAGTVKGDKNGKVPAGFSSIFWNTAWTKGQAPHTLGILCDPKAPLLADFPTEYHSNWQWWDLITKSQIMILNGLPAEVRPTVQVIDDGVTNRRLGLVFEAKVSGGKLVVCSIDIESDLDNRPVARQFRKSLISYISGDDFKPAYDISVEAVQGLMTEPSKMQKLGAKVIKVDSQAAGYEGDKAIDGIATTSWHTQWQPTTPDYPHEIVIGFDSSVKLAGFKYLPRQDMQNGWISEYAVHVSTDGQAWSDVVSAGTFERTSSEKTVMFDNAADCKFIKFVAKNGIDGQKFAAIAEFDIVIAD